MFDQLCDYGQKRDPNDGPPGWQLQARGVLGVLRRLIAGEQVWADEALDVVESLRQVHAWRIKEHGADPYHDISLAWTATFEEIALELPANPMCPRPPLPERIQTRRKARGLSQHELGLKCDRSAQTVSRWERAAATPTPVDRRHLKAALGGALTDYEEP
jgi:DNA-binding XRE family transcriptional regulator